MSTFHTAGGKTYYLGTSIGSTDTTILLSSFLEPVSDIPYTMVLLNTDIVYATIAPGTSSSEFISFTGIVQNANGTATLTGVTRGLAKKYPYTASATFRLPHSGQSIFILSDAPQIFEKYVSIENTETIAGTKTFSSTPINTGGLPVNPTDLATKQYVDNTATGTTSINRTIVAGTAGETIAVDQLIYLKVSDGRWWLCDADTAATVENVILGIAQGAGTAGNAITSGVLIQGLNTFSALTLTANTKYYASNTAGGFSSTPGTKEVSLGESQTTTTFLFIPRFDQQLTEDQQDALAGTDGTPSSSNPYVTASDDRVEFSVTQNAAQIYAASATGNDTYVVTLSPVPASLVNGMHIFVKVDVGNTGAASINVNSLGPQNIVTGISTALVTGDMVANGIYELIYNSTGTVWQLVNPASTVLSRTSFNTGTTSRDISTASGSQTIAHGLGVTPRFVKIRAIIYASTSTASFIGLTSDGAYNGTTQNCIGIEGATAAGGNRVVFVDTTHIVHFLTNETSSGDAAIATISVDATNITLAWVKTASPTGTAQIIWEAYY